MRRSQLLSLVGLGVAVGAGFAACKLDLDESLIGADGGPGSGGSGGSGLGGSGGFGAGSGGKEAGPACDANTQCAIDGGCLEGVCVSGNCSYEICPAPSACQGRACNASTQKCGAPTAIEFDAATIEIPGGVNIGCGGSPMLCVAAFEDYAFVGTDDGAVHAWRLTDPKNPVALTVEAPIFTISRMLASEGRLLLLGPVQDGKLQLAWIDPPTDPQATTLTVTSAGVSFATGIAAAYPATFGGFLLVDASPFNTAFAEPPIANNSTLEAFPVSLPNGSVVAASHTTLVGLFVDSSVVPFVTTLTTFEDAGTAATASGTQVAMGFEAPSSLGAHRFTSTRDGSVLWTTNRVDRDEAGTASSSALVLRWLVPDATGQIDPNPPQIEIATYASDDPETIRAGQSALIDSSSAITTMLNPTDPAATLVRAVKKTNGALELQSGNAPLPFAPSAIGVAATRKFGLVLTPGATFPAQNVSLHVYAPSCG